MILRRIEQRSGRDAGRLAGEFARAPSAEKEAILAGLEFKRWLAESCREAREDIPDSHE